jgi:hypothetical protein
LPDQTSVQGILSAINEIVLTQKYDAKYEGEHFKVLISDHGSGELRIIIPLQVSIRKLKDKFLEKREQFDKGEINLIVLDITSMVEKFDTYDSIMRKVFDDAADDLISCVVLFRRMLWKR